MNKEQFIDLLKRAAWTFCQTALATWALSDFALTKAAGIAALAAGLSALKTYIIASS